MGWEQFQSKRQHIKIFQCEKNNDFFQIVIPTDKRLNDYKEAMYKAVVTVSEAENKSVEQGHTQVSPDQRYPAPIGGIPCQFAPAQFVLQDENLFAKSHSSCAIS